MTLTCIILGLLSFIYFIVIAIAGHGTNFFFIWAIIAGIFFIAAYLLHKGIWNYLPMVIKAVVGTLLIAGCLTFIVVETMILECFFDKGERSLDYIVVLGAQLKQEGPSRVLQMRLDTAYEYLMNNEETLVILSGGQGSDEPTSEAEGMKEYLVEKGISEGRMLLEDTSKNTYENIRNSAELFDIKQNTVGIISNNFHVFRAYHLAKKAGYVYPCAIAAPSEAYMLPNNMLREFFGVVKDFLKGAMT